MQKLTKYNFIEIIDFLTCCEKIKLKNVSSWFYNSILCKPMNYKNLYACGVCRNNVANTIKVLNRYIRRKDVTSIHFDSEEQRKIACVYLKDFGEISHVCCGGKGVMYKTEILNIFNPRRKV